MSDPRINQAIDRIERAAARIERQAGRWTDAASGPGDAELVRQNETLRTAIGESIARIDELIAEIGG